MAMNAAHDAALAHRANLNIASAVVAKLGTGASDSLIDHVTNDVRASHSLAELASAGGMAMVLGAVETSIARNTDASRPFNLTDSRAAQLAAHGTHGGHGHHDGAFSRYGLLPGSRGKREASNDENGGSGAGNGSASRGTGSEPAGSAFWGTAKGMLLTRSYANDNDMGWAPTDLMKMGRPALQALKESGLKGDGYKALRKPSGLHFDNPTVVSGAEYMRRNGCDYNGAARSSAEVDGLRMPDEMRRRHRAAVQGVLTSTRENERQRREDLRKSGDEIVQHDPTHKDAVERERRGYKVDQGKVLKAEIAARKDGAEAKKDDAESKQKYSAANMKDAQAVQKQDQAKNRRAAAQNNFGSL